MKKFHCTCGSSIFFENTQCIACNSELGWCPCCGTLRALMQHDNGQYFCSEPTCNAALTKCHNYAVEHVCNRCVTTPLTPQTEATADPLLCNCCRFNDTIPDLTVASNREKWKRIETAKRRLFYTLDSLGLPYGNENEGVIPPLSFDFKGDVIHKKRFWRKMKNQERVYTGHANGKVTINIKEADDIERETARVSMDEAHRTIIGHFRHEIGHYFWDVLVLGKCEAEYIAVFGDHNNPDYSTALDTYYANGPRKDWQNDFVSAYATMHSWEDFAECFAAYLDMVSIIEVANTQFAHHIIDPRTTDFTSMALRYSELGILFNEFNRTMGLLDLVPEVFTPAVLYKIEFIHNLLRNASNTPAMIPVAESMVEAVVEHIAEPILNNKTEDRVEPDMASQENTIEPS